MSAVLRFSRTALNNGEGTLGSGAVPRPLEAVYQDELYRTCFSLLGNIYISSEWSGKDKNGRVDFLVCQVNWAIECVRDGSRSMSTLAGSRKEMHADNSARYRLPAILHRIQQLTADIKCMMENSSHGSIERLLC
ncbi:hypothetical protein VTN77DRAFT_7656 [Rasamsonia byssochlamydoides]|uniref:uncharacterized protein n=1 Tax=Rasamsonia byssochlamydoides TaxID=89139 RepID=UPI003743F1C2